VKTPIVSRGGFVSSKTLRIRLLFAIALALSAVAIVVATASATAPGNNGRIAFRRYFDAHQSWGAVFTIAADGKGTRQITHPARGIVDDQPDWAPDGSLIAFSRCCAPGSHLFVVAPNGSGLRPVGPLCPPGADPLTCSNDSQASFSPDSKQLVFGIGNGHVVNDQIEHAAIAIMNLDGSARHVIYEAAPYSADVGGPVFSPDGKQLIFERINSAVSSPAGKRAIFVVGVDGSNPRQLTPWAQNDGDNPDWSPNGTWILFRSFVDDPRAQSQLFLIHPDGTGRRQVTHFRKGTNVTSSSFSPNGNSIVLGKGPEGGNIDVYTMRLGGTRMYRVTRSKLWDSAPDWGPR